MSRVVAWWNALGGGSRALVAAVSLVLLAAAVFAPTIRHEFVWDDHEQVVNNKHLRSWGNFGEFWRKDILALSREGQDVHSNYYRPLFYTQLLAYYQMFGLDARAWHALAIAHQALAALAAFLLLSEIGLSLWVAWAAAALFVVHPAHGESASWIAAAFNDPPAATLLLLGLTAHARWLRSGRVAHVALGSAAYAAALLLKESALSMLLLVPLLDAFVREGQPRGRPGRLAGLAPYLAVTLAYFAVRKAAIGTAFGVYHGALSLDEILPTLPLLALFYVRLLVWPFGLSPSYPLRAVPDWSHPAAWGSLLALAALVVATAALVRGRPVPRFSALWVACSIWPVFNIRSFRPTYLAHQRYLYLAALGLCLAIAWGLARGVRGARTRALALGALLAVWSASNLVYDRYWATDVALWTRVAEVDPKNPAAFDWLGAQAMKAGRNDDAERLFRLSIAADPDSPFGYKNLATLLHTRRRLPEEALPLYERAIAGLRARLPAQSDQLADALRNYGVCLSEIGRLDDAIAATMEAVDTPPYPRDAAINAAVLFLQAGRPARAKEVLRAALARRPGDPEIILRLGELHLMTGEPAEALAYAEELRRSQPESEAARNLEARARSALSAR